MWELAGLPFVLRLGSAFELGGGVHQLSVHCCVDRFTRESEIALRS